MLLYLDRKESASPATAAGRQKIVICDGAPDHLCVM